MGLPVSGNAVVITWTPTAGSPVTITTDSTDIDFTDEYGTESAAHRAATAASVPGEHTIELSVGLIATSDTGVYKNTALRPTATGNTGTIVIKWEGTGVGGPSETWTAFQTTRNVSAAVNGVTEGEIAFSATGEITYGTIA
jgi:hypothetical protein